MPGCVTAEAAACAQLHRALAIDRRNAVPELPTIAADLLDLGEAELERGNNVAADTLVCGVVSVSDAHPSIADSAYACVIALNDLGGATWLENKLPESAAQTYYPQALAIYRAAGIGDLAQAAFTLTNLAGSLEEQGDPRAAIPLVLRAIDIISRSESPDHPDAALAWVQLGALNREMGNIPLARAQTTRGLTILAGAGPIARRLFVQAQTWSALMLLAEQRARDTRTVLTRALDTASVEFKPDDPRLADVQDAMGNDMLALHVLCDLSRARGDSVSSLDPASATAPRSSGMER